MLREALEKLFSKNRKMIPTKPSKHLGSKKRNKKKETRKAQKRAKMSRKRNRRK